MAVVQFINGLFEANHPLDSVVEYPNTENVSRKLRKLLSDAERSVKTGLMSESDGRAVVEYTERLYRELYQGYDELKEADVMLKDWILTYSEEAELKGREEGRKEGMEKGIEKGREEVARSMLARGMALPDIAEIAGLSLDKIQALSQG